MMDLSVRILRTGVLALVCATLICSTATIRATHEANTATWTFGNIHIGADTTLTFGGNDSRAIRLIADGTGYLSEGNIIIEKTFDLDGANGGGNGSNGGARKFGSGAGGDDKTSRRTGETGSSSAYGRGGKGAGGQTDSSSQNKGGGGGAFGGSGGASKLGSPVGGTWYGRLDLSNLGTSGGPRAGSGGGAGNRGAGGSGGGPKPEQATLIIIDAAQANDKATLQIQITDLQGRVMFKQAFA